MTSSNKRLKKSVKNLQELDYLKAKEIVRNYEDLKSQNRDFEINQQNKKLIGKTYKYRNSYGGGEEGWWLYVQIVGVDGTSLLTDNFEYTSHNKVEISQETRSCYYGSGLDNSYQEIPLKEFHKAKKDILAKMNLINAIIGESTK